MGRRAFIYASTSSSLWWICSANQVNHSIKSDNECGMLLNKLTNPLATPAVSESKTLDSLDRNSEQKMRLRVLTQQKNTPTPTSEKNTILHWLRQYWKQIKEIRVNKYSVRTRRGYQCIPPAVWLNAAERVYGVVPYHALRAFVTPWSLDLKNSVLTSLLQVSTFLL